jgi:hypothetical protein
MRYMLVLSDFYDFFTRKMDIFTLFLLDAEIAEPGIFPRDCDLPLQA